MNRSILAKIIFWCILTLFSSYFLVMGFIKDPQVERELDVANKLTQDSIVKVQSERRNIRYHIAPQSINGAIYDALKLDNCYEVKVYINDTIIHSVFFDTFRILNHLKYKIPIVYGFGQELERPMFFKNKEEYLDSTSAYYNDLHIGASTNLRIYEDSRK